MEKTPQLGEQWRARRGVVSGSVGSGWGHFVTAGKVGLKSGPWEIEGFLRKLGLSGIGNVYSREGYKETGSTLSFRKVV